MSGLPVARQVDGGVSLLLAAIRSPPIALQPVLHLRHRTTQSIIWSTRCASAGQSNDFASWGQ